ncbi:CHAD domain-containing protein [Nostocaceae cyanobacterium CENA369]|uniref:CHAD domain-containing protein n=1 Tax=Dendronalium phyllosphericum CENA369 TaxID=1725256 RepID=A0A8J7I374_9NOST|nr:CHAD domain-containing protein [Dendronalium phyllosphericum]MBH8573805.1 CHAD domain-containing protein [Dendronalium phyllosphericum CENA369]
MKLATEPTVKTLGDYAYQAIQKHLKKTLKWEKSVKKDEDPEALHQMRVGMRRLRTATSRFEIALSLPKPARDKNIGKIARRLGNLRDLDVLKEALKTLYQPHLPHKEQKSLETAFDALAKQRKDALSTVQTTLKDESYKSLKQALEEWLDKPSYQPVASLPIQQVLPDLLLPEVSRFLLHPGWLVGTQVVDSEVTVHTNWKAEKLEQQLTTQGDTIHDLRKQAKRVRYQMELFTDLYGESYAAYIAEVKSIQEILGNIQDIAVMSEWLTDVFQSEIHKELPTLAALLAENRYKSWQQWQPLQERYLKAENKHSFHLTILHPL